jgi:hypothetical protein
MSTYSIFEENGKLGLARGSIVLLNPVYNSLAITNNDPPEFTLKDFEHDPSIYIVDEWNYPIVTADGKQGLIGSERMFLDIKYDRVVKLTYCHYFSQVDTVVSLYFFDALRFSSYDQITLIMPREFTLECLLNKLAEQYTYLYTKLSEKLHKNGPGRYTSDYRCYIGDQYTGVFHGFLIGITKYILHDDFHSEKLSG